MSNLQGVPQGSYARAASYLVGIARHFKLPVTEREANEWVVLMTAMQPINHYLDLIQDPGDRARYAERVLSILEAGINNLRGQQYADLVSTLTALHEVLLTLPASRMIALVKYLREYFSLTERIKTTTRATTYSYATLKEGVATAQVLVSLLPDTVLEHHNYSRFYRLLKHVNIVVNLWDNVKDLRGDKQ